MTGEDYENCTEVGQLKTTKTPAGWHTYSVYWAPTHVTFKMDGVPYNRVNSTQYFSSNSPKDPYAPFDQPFYLILNLAMGGDWPESEGVDIDTSKRWNFDIDWIRVYSYV